MKIGTLGKTLILLGVIILLYALNMAVAMPGSDIVNIHLISERQNMIVIGGMLFIGGIILFSVERLKQTEDENAKEKSRQIENTEKERQKFENLLGHSMQNAPEIPSSIVSLWRRFFIGPDDGGKAISIRLAAGVCVGVIATLAVHYLAREIVDWSIVNTTNANNLLKVRLIDWSEKLSMLAFVLIALRTGPMLNALKHVFLVGLTIMLIAVAHYIAVNGGSSLSLRSYGSIAFLAVGVVVVAVIQRKQMSA